MKKFIELLAVLGLLAVTSYGQINVHGDKNFTGDVNLDGNWKVKSTKITATGTELNQLDANAFTGPFNVTGDANVSGATTSGTLAVTGKATLNGELEANDDVDINLTETTHEISVTQTNATGADGVPLASITDARTGTFADEADEASVVIVAAGVYGLSVEDGIVNIEGEIDSTGDITLDPAGDDVICDGTVDATAYTADAGSGIDVKTAGALDIGNTVATTIDYGSSAVTVHTLTASTTGDAVVVLPLLSVGDGEINDLSAAKLNAASVASAIDGNAITNLDLANLAAGTTAAAFDGSAITALDAANITAGTVLPAVDASAVTNLGIWAEPTFVTDAITAGSLFSTSTVTILDLDGNTMTGKTMVHVWNDTAATAITFPDGVEVEVVAAEEDYWVAITNSGTLQVVIEDASITTNIFNTAVGPRVVEETITLLP